MILDNLVTHLKRRMESILMEELEEHPNNMLTPSVFFGSTGQHVSDWTNRMQEKHPEMLPLDKDRREELLESDGVVMNLSCQGVRDQKDMDFLHATVVPFIITHLEAQSVVWAMSAHFLAMDMEGVESHEEARDLIHEAVKNVDINETQECLLIIAVDREVTQTWRASVHRDSDGNVCSVDDWQPGPQEMGMMGFQSFTDNAQAALRKM